MAKAAGNADIDGLSILNVEFGKAEASATGVSGNFIPQTALAFTRSVDFADVKSLDYLYTSSAFLPENVGYYSQTVRYTGRSNVLFKAADISPVKDPTVFRRGLDENAQAYAERMRNAGLTSFSSYFWSPVRRLGELSTISSLPTNPGKFPSTLPLASSSEITNASYMPMS